ncbi:uncharacterized protein LOC121253392 [Juglans microcarpa x Juglans regia]|uniref:uncharacterized protein LOC121253392 n=1 Tax=Juglans microcarpa x Juglans regia TaxID=2249226 RepID=UPI001B7DB447|nr:uncharacterized protein LOC121253392 [Juglans microcarpa x Juglans regia]
MEEELARQWEGLSLIEQERNEVVIPFITMEKAVQQGQLCLLALIIAEKVVNKEAFKNTMTKIWRIERWIQFYEVGFNMFLIEFNKEEDRQCVINGRPWSFDRWLLCLHVFEGNMPINEGQFNKKAFWLQVHNMPFACMTQEVGY